MKTQLIGIAVLLFAILLEMESNDMGGFCLLLGFIGLIVTLAGASKDNEK